MSTVWAIVAVLAIAAAWDAIRRIFIVKETKALASRLDLLATELRRSIGNAETDSRTRTELLASDFSARLSTLEYELPALRTAAEESQAYAKSIHNKVESATLPPRSRNRWG